MLFLVEARERRVLHNAVRSIVFAALGNGDGAGGAFRVFTQELFPEKAEKDRAFESRSAKVLDDMGEKPIAVQPVAPVGSVWGNRFRQVRVGAGPKAPVPTKKEK